MDAVVGMVLLIPAVIAFLVDRLMQKKQVALLSACSVPLISSSNRREAYGNSIHLVLYTAII
jgi:iron(III) transport system permease protein